MSGMFGIFYIVLAGINTFVLFSIHAGIPNELMIISFSRLGSFQNRSIFFFFIGLTETSFLTETSHGCYPREPFRGKHAGE